VIERALHRLSAIYSFVRQ